MSRVLFISDFHFGHKWMAHHRGFQDEFYQDERIIDNWNNTVGKNDLVYILGDITMNTTKWYYQLDRLNGRKIVVLGNHDPIKGVRELLDYVETVGGNVEYKGYILSHAPVHPREIHDNEYKTKFLGNIHGHVHEYSLADTDHYINVSAENIGYTPRTLDELLNKRNDNKGDQYEIKFTN